MSVSVSKDLIAYDFALHYRLCVELRCLRSLQCYLFTYFITQDLLVVEQKAKEMSHGVQGILVIGHTLAM